MKFMKSNKIRKTIITGLAAAFLAAALFLSFASVQTVFAAPAGQAKEIWSYEDLCTIADDPAGSYVLMADIDLKDKNWTPVDFTGTFDGNGHAVLNAGIRGTGAKTFLTYDGNMIDYDTSFGGFFSSLVGATVNNLKILGIDISLDTANPTFVGGITGFMENSTVSGCTVSGTASLTTTGKSFGIGGFAGFGNGLIENSSADMTLVCTDKDVEDKDEQFMGGAYASGYIDLRDNKVKISGFDSDHGYVHDGGLVGMYILYPEDTGYEGFITGNTVEGKITFFEDNEDRRAYCEAYIGEIMNWTFAYDDEFNPDNFIRDEVYDYSTDLVPHTCTDPEFETTNVASTETENGYTESRCSKCGYVLRKDYIPVLGNPVPKTTGTDGEPETESKPEEIKPEKKGGSSGLIIVIVILIVLALIAMIILLLRAKNLKQQQNARAQRRKSGRPPSDRRR